MYAPINTPTRGPVTAQMTPTRGRTAAQISIQVFIGWYVLQDAVRMQHFTRSAAFSLLPLLPPKAFTAGFEYFRGEVMLHSVYRPSAESSLRTRPGES